MVGKVTDSSGAEVRSCRDMKYTVVIMGSWSWIMVMGSNPGWVKLGVHSTFAYGN